MKKNHKEIKIPLIIYLFLLVIQISYAGELQGLQFPNLFTLLSQKIVMVASDGIHFFTSNLEEDPDKKINFENQITTTQENDKVSIVQFTENDGTVIGLFKDGVIVDEISDEGDIVLDETCFYAESGGEIADTGKMRGISWCPPAHVQKV